MATIGVGFQQGAGMVRYLSASTRGRSICALYVTHTSTSYKYSYSTASTFFTFLQHKCIRLQAGKVVHEMASSHGSNASLRSIRNIYGHV